MMKKYLKIQTIEIHKIKKNTIKHTDKSRLVELDQDIQKQGCGLTYKSKDVVFFKWQANRHSNVTADFGLRKLNSFSVKWWKQNYYLPIK